MLEYFTVAVMGGAITWLLFYLSGNLYYDHEITKTTKDDKSLLTREELISAILSFDEKLLTHRFYRHGWGITSRYLKDNKWDEGYIKRSSPWILATLYKELYLIDVKDIKKYEN